MNSFLRDIEKKFLVLEDSEYCDGCGNPIEQCTCESEELDEESSTGGVAGFNTPAAFAAPGKWKNKQAKYESKVNESINTPPTWHPDEAQRPESDEEIFNDKFPFASHDQVWWESEAEYPVKFKYSYGTATIKDTTTRTGNLPEPNKTKQIAKNTLRVEDVIEKKYEQLIEGYRDFKSGDDKPSVKVKKTIQEIAKKLQEIENLVNYNNRLKTESGVTSNVYGPSTTKALTKISERLIKISERIRSLGE